jgi:GxxExxY protein
VEHLLKVDPHSQSSQRKERKGRKDMEINQLSNVIIGCAIRVHRELGPGLLESIYSPCLQLEFQRAGLAYETQVPVPIRYDGLEVPNALRLDFVVENQIVVELKCIEKVLPVHHAQLLSYLRLSDKQLGLLINFHVNRLADGIKRIVNNLPE